MDILLTDEHDIDFVNGEATVTSTLKDSVAQRLKVRLSTFRGEWFADTNIGIDYFGSVFGKNRKKTTVDIIFQTEILADEDVLKILEFTSSLHSNREYEVDFKVQIVDGTVAAVNVQIGV